MKIDLGKIDTERFRVREKDGLTLINPDAAMWDWKDDELHMRSLLCRDDGEVVSAGYPKFFNYGERPNHPQIWQDHNKRTITYKEDGTLIIASLIDGKLHLRTRGNHDLGNFHDKVLNVLRKKNLDTTLPLLLNKIAGEYSYDVNKVSILMEYVAPDNLIVMKYNKENLIMLGVSIYYGNEIKIKSSEFLIPYLPSQTHASLHEVDEDTKSSGQSFVEYVSKFPRNIEGFVVNLRNDTDNLSDVRYMLKFKTEWYMRLHGLMTETESRIDELLFFECIFTEKRFLSYFQGLGYDWETCMFLLDNRGARAKMEEMKARIELVKNTLTIGQRMKADLDSGITTRKDIALSIRNNFPRETHGIIFGLLDNKHEMPALAHIAGASPYALKAKDDLPPLDKLLKYV